MLVYNFFLNPNLRPCVAKFTDLPYVYPNVSPSVNQSHEFIAPPPSTSIVPGESIILIHPIMLPMQYLPQRTLMMNAISRRILLSRLSLFRLVVILYF